MLIAFHIDRALRSLTVVLLLLLAAGVQGVACVSPADEAAAPGPVSAPSTIVLSDDERTVWLTSPDDDSVVQLGSDDLQERGRVHVSGAPASMVRVGERLLVTRRYASAVALIDTNMPAAPATDIALPCGGALAAVATSDIAWVACAFDDRLVMLDLAERRAIRFVELPARATALTLVGDRLHIALVPGELHVLDARSLVEPDVTFDDAHIDTLVMHTMAAGVASRIVGVAADPSSGHIAALYDRVIHDGDRDAPPEAAGYGALHEGRARIEPRVFAACASRYASFSSGDTRAFSGPAAIAWSAAARHLWLVNTHTANVAVVSCDLSRRAAHDEDAAPDHIATFRTGPGPMGIVLSRSGTYAWVDVAFDHALARLELSDGGGALREPALVRTRALGATRMSPEALRGRRIFHDATRVQLTPNGAIACASCHPGGDEDGLRWFLHTAAVPAKLRRTPPAWSGRVALAPLHWDGEFADAGTLTLATITGLMGGTGFLVDTEAVARWLDEIPLPLARPAADDAEAAQRARGEALFNSSAVGCAECHTPPLYSDGRSHRTLPLPTDPFATTGAVATPTLIGVRARAPFMHDGRGPSLAWVLANHATNAGPSAAALDATQRADLLAFLDSL